LLATAPAEVSCAGGLGDLHDVPNFELPVNMLPKNESPMATSLPWIVIAVA
jgi:hypothetical protein